MNTPLPSLVCFNSSSFPLVYFYFIFVIEFTFLPTHLHFSGTILFGAPGVSMKGRHPTVGPDATPGPNAYDPDRKEKRGITMAGKGRNPDISDTPGFFF